MKDERIQELALQAMDFERDGSQPGLYIDNAIRLALAERDREVAEWAKHQREVSASIRGGDLELDDYEMHGGRMDALADLLAFLEAQP